jgi:hypothetical protein
MTKICKKFISVLFLAKESKNRQLSATIMRKHPKYCPLSQLNVSLLGGNRLVPRVFHQECLHKFVQVAVKHPLYVRCFNASAQIFYQFIGVQYIIAYL